MLKDLRLIMAGYTAIHKQIQEWLEDRSLNTHTHTQAKKVVFFVKFKRITKTGTCYKNKRPVGWKRVRVCDSREDSKL
jgi:hypothetical protein